MPRRSPLDDPETAAHAWGRFRRLMRLMMVLTVAVVGIALGLIYRESGMVSAHLFVAAALGIGFTMLLMAALMGLLFLSSGTGYDESVADFDADRQDRDGRSR